MRVAVVGPVDRRVRDIARYIPDGTKEMIVANLHGICLQALKWADQHNMPRVVVSRDFVPSDQGALSYLRAVVSEADLVVLIDDKRSDEVRIAKQYAQLMRKELETTYI